MSPESEGSWTQEWEAEAKQMRDAHFEDLSGFDSWYREMQVRNGRIKPNAFLWDMKPLSEFAIYRINRDIRWHSEGTRSFSELDMVKASK